MTFNVPGSKNAPVIVLLCYILITVKKQNKKRCGWLACRGQWVTSAFHDCGIMGV